MIEYFVKGKQRNFIMETKYYTVIKIEGEYAYLAEEGNETAENIFVAMALLPPESDVGTKLKCEYFQYTIAD